MNQNQCWVVNCLLVVCSKMSVLYIFRDITTYTMYVTNCDLAKSFRVDAFIQIVGYVYVAYVLNCRIRFLVCI